MRVLAVGCHPDDLEIGCYGTLAKYAAQGAEVSVCHVANGNLGHVEILPDELRRIRFDEAEEAASIIGAKHYSVEIGDLYVKADDDKLVDRLAEVVRKARPDVIITHAENDYMNDHVETCRALMRASFCASLPHWNLAAREPTHDVCPVFHMDTLSGLNFVPTRYVDITGTLDVKLKALSCHHSQIDWMREHDHIDFLDFVRCCSRVRGFQCGVAYAEGYRPSLNYLRMSAGNLLP